MNNKVEPTPSRVKIVEYWKDKYISKNLEIVSSNETDSLPVIDDWGEPECWACGEFHENIYLNPAYLECIKSGENCLKVWDFPEAKFLQKAHIVPKMLGGEKVPSNYFLLCKRCHQESPDFIDSCYFFAYIRHTRNNAHEVRARRENEIMRAVYELCNELNKNILTFDLGLKNSQMSFSKMGFHITSFSPYTIAAAIVDGMDNLEIEKLSCEELLEIQEQYSKFNIVWKQSS